MTSRRQWTVSVLRGPEHTELGLIRACSPHPDVALALSRGKFAKRYSYTDPNEDFVAAAVAQSELVLAVCDGHNGADSGEIAIEELVKAVTLRRPEADRRAVETAVFWGIHTAILDHTKAPGSRTPESRTTLATGRLVDGVLHWATVGDSALFVVGSDRARRLDRPAMRFLGYAPMTRAGLSQAMQGGIERLVHGDVVLLATDGLTDFVPLLQAQLHRWLAETDSLRTIANALIQRAFDGGAGDNVGVALARA